MSSKKVSNTQLYNAIFIKGCNSAAHRMNNLDQVQKILDTGYAGMPQPQDTEKCVVFYNSLFLVCSDYTRPKYYVPRNPFQTPIYYPQTVLSVLSSPALFAQLDIETLFYVFYYLPGTYQQYVTIPFRSDKYLFILTLDT